MSESAKPKSSPASGTTPPRTPTNPEAFKAMSAARMAGIKQAEQPKTGVLGASPRWHERSPVTGRQA